ncbi:phosphatidylinositol 3,4,5-trisphosphate 3-phosphatase and protein-tyrosine-phosphatase PTEN2A-like isoform X2 [Arachis duranensis]|uniref:Phosphatidylinositol 3,4,5-trisphosphate 3-phosphatase and protein-tyrosine-phosphatase PTEN2A-like isoform X2 n=1 Tax=Arachis duranensis TaxID=130453 RepID=A0A9C6TDP6_ARADU|nr:phosphatidylinositol 3,4,5-trisphosphate 3-phosphatase and protein-tyrosine-phosphatase PTEN2A-like isoform X2 [Arachis duranensis]XP_052112267.1 phosphatidylinositol 3,4,5-trisphosphate 3-phosphatase and protein-tyrosine-phosphatase PTEN2A-like isoform X2 [Arachis duranensis]
MCCSSFQLLRSQWITIIRNDVLMEKDLFCPVRLCMLRGFRLHRCPYWIRPSITVSDHSVLFSTKKHPRTKDLLLEDFWFSALKKGVMVFALPGEPGLTELAGDFKIHFHDRQGDFYCWLNTTMKKIEKY